MKAPSTKHQAPMKHQASNLKTIPCRIPGGSLGLGIWSFSGAWCLELGTF
jgi:hypothetical protein